MVEENTSARQAMVDLLHQSNSGLLDIMDSMSDLVVISDVRQRIKVVNRTLLKKLGYREEELLGQPVWVLRPPERRDEAKQALAKLNSDRGAACQLPMVAKDGTEIPVHTQISRLRLNEANFNLAISRESGSFERALVDMRHELDLVRGIFESSPDPILITDLTGEITDCSRSSWQANGYPDKESLRGKSVLEFFEKETHARIMQDMLNTLGKGQSSTNCYLLHNSSSQADQAEVSLAVLHDQRGQPAGFVIIVRAVKEQLNLERELCQSQKVESVSRLAGGLAHDYNNILTAVRSYATVVSNSLEPDHSALDDIAQVIQACGRAEKLTRRLQAFSRSQVMHPKLLDLGSSLRDMQPRLSDSIKPGIQLSLNIPNDLWSIDADPERLEQALHLLIDNSTAAMPQGGQVSISAQNARDDDSGFSAPASPDYVLLQVSDTGLGIAEEIRERMFEPFVTTSQEEGAGLGLAEVYGIVSQHRGQVSAENLPQGGARAMIYLPRAGAKATRLSQTAQQLAGQKLPSGDETVLVVENEPLVKALTVKNLSSLGYRVLEAENGDDAQRLAQENQKEIDLLIIEMDTPPQGAVDLCARLAQSQSQAPILFISGQNDEQQLSQLDQSQNWLLLEKPFNLDKLARAVRTLLDRSE